MNITKNNNAGVLFIYKAIIKYTQPDNGTIRKRQTKKTGAASDLINFFILSHRNQCVNKFNILFFH